MHPERYVLVATATLTLVLSGCSEDDESTAPPADVEIEETPTSPKANVRFKGTERMRIELARALGLPRQDSCKELGEFDCYDVHNVVLGGTDPFGVALYKPVEHTSATTPLAVERIVLTACTERAGRDFADPSNALVFAGLTVDENGELVDPDAPATAAAIDRLYQRALQRNAKESEQGHFRLLYNYVQASGESTAPARDWATLSCFAVMTSLEWLFY